METSVPTPSTRETKIAITKAGQALRQALPPTEWDAVRCWLSTFYLYQRAWLLDWSRFALLLKARQIGASHSYAAACVLWAMLGETTTVISVGEREAAEVLDKARKHAQALERLGSRWAKLESDSAEEIRLASGGRVVALPSTSGGRSYSGNVLLDEFAYHKRPTEVWDGAAAVVMHGYRLRVLSTPNGVGNLFHRLWSEPKAHDGYRLHRVTLDEARADGLRVDEAECWRMARGDPRVYDQLFRCSFLDAEEQYIPTALIEAASVEPEAVMGEAYAGLDVGLTNDLTALCVLRVGPDGRRHVQEVETCKRTSWDDQLAMVLRSHGRWRWRRLCVDATGLGAVPAQILVRKFGGQIVNGKAAGGIVEPVEFTQTTKEDMATRLYASFANKTIAIPKADSRLRDDLCALRRIVTAAGNVRYDADRTDAGHADRAWALALALTACGRPQIRRDLSNLPPF